MNYFKTSLIQSLQSFEQTRRYKAFVFVQLMNKKLW